MLEALLYSLTSEKISFRERVWQINIPSSAEKYNKVKFYEGIFQNEQETAE
jgi:hypothetical protein